jgi:hypothetical protein
MDIGGKHTIGGILTSFADTKNNSVKTEYSIDSNSMEEKDSIDTEYSKYNHYKDSVFSILGIGSNRNKLDPTMNTTLDELRRLWNDNTDYTDIVDSMDSTDSIGSVDSSSDEPPQPKVPTKLTIDGLHKIRGSYKWGVITDTLPSNQYYIIEFHTNDKAIEPMEATIYREPVEFGKIRIDIRESGKAKVQYHTQREGFRNRKDFATELFALADDYIEGEYYK